MPFDMQSIIELLEASNTQGTDGAVKDGRDRSQCRGLYALASTLLTRSVGTASINVASSSLARELFTRLDTAHRCSTWFAAGLPDNRAL
jgi:hypothetical protein